MKTSSPDKPSRPHAFFASNLPGLLTLKDSIQEGQTDPNLTISWISESAVNLLKMAGTEWRMGDSFKQRILEFSNIDIAPIFSDFSKKGEGYYHLAMESGSSIGLNLSQSPIGIIGQIHYPVNQQEQKAEQPKLHQSISDEQTLLKEIAENINSIIWIRDPKELKFLYINSYFEKFSGYKIEQLRTDTNSLFKFIHPDDQPFLMQLYEMPIETNMTIEFRFKLADQTYRWLEAKLLTLADEEGTIIHRMGIATDITEKRNKVESLQLALEQEKEINKLKSMFVSMVSHQFKTPLSTMQTSIDLINNYLQVPSNKSSTSIHRHLTILQNEIEKYNNLINDMLILGKIEAGKVKVNFKEIDLVDFCKKIINAYFADNLQGRKVELNHEKPIMLIFLDVALMEHVLVNLLSNALKFSQKSPKIMLESLENELVIKVVDEGIGISKNDISYLFEDFYRASNASDVPGSGLGLSIAKKFVELQKGTIHVESQLGLGTTFRVTLPINRSTH